MSEFEVSVTETRHYSTTYWVEAESQEEAERKAAEGDTLAEAEGTLMEIAERTVTSKPRPTE